MSSRAHAHPHDHPHGHAQAASHQHHGHAHAAASPHPPVPLSPSFMRWPIAARLAVAALASAALWGAVWLAMR